MISEGKMLLETQGIALWLVENDVVKNVIGWLRNTFMIFRDSKTSNCERFERSYF